MSLRASLRRRTLQAGARKRPAGAMGGPGSRGGWGGARRADHDDALLLALVVVDGAHAHGAQAALAQQQPDALHLRARAPGALMRPHRRTRGAGQRGGAAQARSPRPA